MFKVLEHQSLKLDLQWFIYLGRYNGEYKFYLTYLDISVKYKRS